MSSSIRKHRNEPSSPPLSPQLTMLNREQAARFLGVSAGTIDRMRGRGDLSATRVGLRCLRFTSDSLRAYVESRTAKRASGK